MDDSLQIKHVRFFKAVSAISRHIADATHDISNIAFFITEIELANGITGQGYLLSFHFSPNAIAGALKDIADFATQYRVNETVRMRADYDKDSEYFGQTGLLRWPLASVNVAMWDAWGKVNGQPVWKMLGGAYQKVPVYGSGGWLSYSDEELIEEVTGYKKRGFEAVKIKVGAKEAGRDMHRLRIVREAVGKDVKIMMDANQGMDVGGALKLAKEAEALGIFWFEEPVNHTDFAGYETLHLRTSISLAMGEREYDTEALKNLISVNAIDLWQPDIIRIGGVEPWRDSAALAAAYHVPVLPHYYKDYDVPLLCTVPNGFSAEFFDWIDELIDNRMVVEDGMAMPREAPGWGFGFRHEKMTQI